MAIDKEPQADHGERSDVGLDMPASVGSKLSSSNKSSGKSAKTLITTIVIIIVLVVAGWLVNQFTSINLLGGNTSSATSSASANYNSDSYYAVFLSNGQVYFGKVVDSDGTATILEDIYYLQVSNPLQQVPPPGTQAQPQ